MVEGVVSAPKGEQLLISLLNEKSSQNRPHGKWFTNIRSEGGFQWQAN
jgi:hypothetical protein